MKTKSIVQFVVLLIASARLAGAADNPSEALQKGLLEEEANHNLDPPFKPINRSSTSSMTSGRLLPPPSFASANVTANRARPTKRSRSTSVSFRISATRTFCRAKRENLTALRRGSGSGPADRSRYNANGDGPRPTQSCSKKRSSSWRRKSPRRKRKFKVGRPSLWISQSRRRSSFRSSANCRDAPSAAQKSLLDQQIQLVERLLADKKKQIEVGAAPRSTPCRWRGNARPETRIDRHFEGTKSGTRRRRRRIHSNQARRRGSQAHPTIPGMGAKQSDLLNAKESGGFTPLHNAAGQGRIEVARFLLEHGADVNSRTSAARLLCTPQRAQATRQWSSCW